MCVTVTSLLSFQISGTEIKSYENTISGNSGYRSSTTMVGCVQLENCDFLLFSTLAERAIYFACVNFFFFEPNYLRI